MKHRTVLYYSFCHANEMTPKEYKQYQRQIAGQILAYGFETEFHITFDRKYVKKGIHGKPFWTGSKKVYFNVSNTEGLVVCALSRIETGVDAEMVRFAKEEVIQKCCTETEIAYISGKSAGRQKEYDNERFFQLWTLKESYIKMTGLGMRFPIREAEFFIAEAEAAQKISCSQPGYFTQKRLGEYWISLCTCEEAETAWKELPLDELRERGSGIKG